MKDILNFIFIGHGPWVFIGVFLLSALVCEEFCTLIKTVMNGLGRIIHGEPRINNNYISSDKQVEKADGKKQ